MPWYDTFATFYDASLERHYAVPHREAVDALDVRPDSIVLDVPVGTGQALPHLAPRAGRVIGIDLSDGMLARARARVERAGWANVDLVAGDAARLRPDDLPARPDRLHVFLGTTVFPDPEATLDALWALLAPGGRVVLVDVHAARPGLQGRIVQCMAQADLTRTAWTWLERRAPDARRVVLRDAWSDGGTLWLATGTRPRTPRDVDPSLPD